jgi:glutamate/tyrosine decarboxylase-like PLP-dependent enzyme
MNKNEQIKEIIRDLIDKTDIEQLIREVIAEKQSKQENVESIAAWFLGPKAEHAGIWLDTFTHIFEDYMHWRRNYFPEDPIILSHEKRHSQEAWFEKLKSEIDRILNQLKAHFPFYSPRYNAHMVSEQTFPSIVGYFAGMLYNPNNVTEESAPITLALEIEVGKMVAEMLGYNPNRAWAHISSGGTIANTEAHWIARMVQFVPMIVQEFCQQRRIKDFEIYTPNGSLANILDLNYRELINQKPSESVSLIRKLAKHLIVGANEAEVFHEINAFLKQSKFNINSHGIYPVLKEIKLTPIIFASEAAHYSVKKAANILGYGENCIQFVPVESHFRMNTDVLREKLFKLNKDNYIASVIGIVGTTEEGAVDPIHKIKFIRDELEKEKNKSFWLHVDAAWGGYIRSLFCGHDFKESHDHKTLREICREYDKKLKLTENIEVRIAHATDNRVILNKKRATLEWRDFEIFSAFLAMPDADSITVDPHKLGYVPYPAGIIAFQKSLVTELVVQKAQYITDEVGGLRSLDRNIEINEVGPYIIEGSKPGASAAACWLAHKTIPLTAKGHGQIIKTSLLNSKKFARYVSLHKKLFDAIEIRLFGKTGTCRQKFGFELLCEPDTNIVCFLCLPMVENEDGELIQDKSFKLNEINNLNQRLYRRSTITNTPKKRKTPYSQEFFVSRTTLTGEQYKPGSITAILEKFDFSIYEYEKHGIFILRSTLMNPWHYLAEKQGKNYLYDFLVNLHQNARDILNE